MIRIEHTTTYGWEAAVRGMRNPMNSWDKSDTKYFDHCGVFRVPEVGPNDLKLMKQLSKAGSDHGKYLRMINVTMDVTAPLYWWKEADTYAVGVVKNSCSTMHKIHAKEFVLDDFSHEHLKAGSVDTLCAVIDQLNFCRKWYLAENDKVWWWQLIQLLPSSYNQKRTVQLNYQVLKNMYHARKAHKLDEWLDFCEWVRSLPYSELITGEEEA